MRADGVSLPRLAAGIAIPALLAGLIAALLLRPEASRILQASHTSSPHFLSREADLPVPAGGPMLHPIVIRGGRAALGRDAPVAASGISRPAPPARITIRSVGLAASVVPVQAASNGDIGVPPPGRAGWFDGGARPGEPGRAVLIGHVDDIAGRLAAFGRIANVRDGAQIKVTDAGGRVHAFQVVGRAQTHKTAFPRDDVYGASQHPVLVLITCGGKWLGRQHGGYRDNILVFARQIS
ncbi:MAG: class F sortase [Gaiellaceae bacterium]